MDNYYDLPYASNSELGALKDAINAKEKQVNLTEIYQFGNLVDAMITEPALINESEKSCYIESDHGWIKFSDDDWQKATAMRESYFENDFCRTMHKVMKFQYVYARKRFRFEWEKKVVFLPFKCKFDYINKDLRISADLKGLSAKTYSAFLQAIEHFNYDRQAALYMDLAGCIDSHTIIGISKHAPHPVFLKTIYKGDRLYLQGRDKYNYLGVEYAKLVA